MVQDLKVLALMNVESSGWSSYCLLALMIISESLGYLCPKFIRTVSIGPGVRWDATTKMPRLAFGQCASQSSVYFILG